MTAAAAIATRPAAPTAAAPKYLPRSDYQTMETAPKDRLILIKTHVKSRVVAVTGQYDPDYGSFVTLALGHHIPVQLYGIGWMEIPEVRIDVVNNFEPPPQVPYNR